MAGKILLTGATGFLGGELLLRLLAEEGRRIVCLVRAPSSAAARERGRETLRALTGSAELAALVEWVPGDLERRGLGLSRRTWDHLASDIEEVFHCAASTRFDLPLDEAHRVNVLAVAELHRLCAEAVARGGFRRLNHVSTAYAAGLAGGERVDADVLPEDRAELFRNTYERTKARAERLLRARWSQVPTTIHRPSIVVGESETGRTSNWNVVYYPMRLMAGGRLPCVPRRGPGLLDCVPVDWVAAAILALARRDDTAGRAFNLVAGEQALSVDRVVAETWDGLCRRHGGRPAVRRPRVLGPLAWGIARRALPRLLPGAERVLDAFAIYEPYTSIAARFQDQRERSLLRAAGLVFPGASEFFPRVVDYALRADFGRAPAVRPEPVRVATPAGLGERLADALATAFGPAELAVSA